MPSALLFGLSTGHKVGLAVVAGAFVLFAIVSALVVPRRWPGYPGAGLRPFVAATVVFFVGMMLAVIFFAKESGEEAEAREHATTEVSSTGPTTTSAGTPHTITVREIDYKILVPSRKLPPGNYVFRLVNAGKDVHNLTISGPEVENAATATIPGGKTAKVQATLRQGTYRLYCSVPGHAQLGMDLDVTVS